jgi:hypothetical protein
MYTELILRTVETGLIHTHRRNLNENMQPSSIHRNTRRLQHIRIFYDNNNYNNILILVLKCTTNSYIFNTIACDQMVRWLCLCRASGFQKPHQATWLMDREPLCPCPGSRSSTPGAVLKPNWWALTTSWHLFCGLDCSWRPKAIKSRRIFSTKTIKVQYYWNKMARRVQVNKLVPWTFVSYFFLTEQRFGEEAIGGISYLCR